MYNCLCHRNTLQNGVNTLSQIVNNFWPKRPKFCIFRIIRFCSYFSSMWSKYLSNNILRVFRLPMSASVKFQNLKINFAVNLTLKLFRATGENTNTGSRKSLHTLFDTYSILGLHVGKIWTKSYRLKFTKFWGFWQKSRSFKTIVDKMSKPFCDKFL